MITVLNGANVDHRRKTLEARLIMTGTSLAVFAMIFRCSEGQTDNRWDSLVIRLYKRYFTGTGRPGMLKDFTSYSHSVHDIHISFGHEVPYCTQR